MITTAGCTCADGGPNLDAPAAEWTPKTPEEILSVTVCDPACGSGTLPVAALRFLTDALYAAHHHHGRVTPADGDELRFKALLRRQVVERCIYGVDIDPLAVELCRLALWIETMDRTLPFSFLDHKIKAGNSLIGAWFDTYQHYPAMAWKQRDALKRSKEIKAFVRPSIVGAPNATLGSTTTDLSLPSGNHRVDTPVMAANSIWFATCLNDRRDHPLAPGQELEQRLSGLVLDLEEDLPAVSPEPPLGEVVVAGQVYGFFERLAQSLDRDAVLDELLDEEQIDQIHEGRMGVLVSLEPAPTRFDSKPTRRDAMAGEYIGTSDASKS